MSDKKDQAKDFQPYHFFSPDFRAKIEMFNKIIQSDPPVVEKREMESFVKDEKGNSRKVIYDHWYVPISQIEKDLNAIFGVYYHTNFRKVPEHPIANEIMGAVDLHVYHPVFDKWVTYQGTAAVMIPMYATVKDPSAQGGRRRSKVTEIEAKIKNGMEMAAPNLLSRCISDAAKRIGRRFGSDLNREIVHDYQPTYLTSEQLLNNYKKEIEDLKVSLAELDRLKKVLEGMSLEQLNNKGTEFFDNVLKEGKLNAGDFNELQEYGRTLFKQRRSGLRKVLPDQGGPKTTVTKAKKEPVDRNRKNKDG